MYAAPQDPSPAPLTQATFGSDKVQEIAASHQFHDESQSLVVFE